LDDDFVPVFALKAEVVPADNKMSALRVDDVVVEYYVES
jgi:hypothetical protein